jgi:hypothetical protein
MTEYEPICLEEGPDEASTCYLPLGHDVPHDWTPTERGYSPEFTATSKGLTEERTADEHKGRFVWRNPEMVWECADDCPHQTHESRP